MQLTSDVNDFVNAKRHAREKPLLAGQHYADLGTDTLSVWNFCTCSSDVILQGNQWWHHEMLAVFFGAKMRC